MSYSSHVPGRAAPRTVPAVSGVPTIVIGQAEQTGKNSTPWVLTVLPAHFHQLQLSHPAYYDGLAALDLAHGEEKLPAATARNQ